MNGVFCEGAVGVPLPIKSKKKKSLCACICDGGQRHNKSTILSQSERRDYTAPPDVSETPHLYHSIQQMQFKKHGMCLKRTAFVC